MEIPAVALLVPVARQAAAQGEAGLVALLVREVTVAVAAAMAAQVAITGAAMVADPVALMATTGSVTEAATGAQTAGTTAVADAEMLVLATRRVGRSFCFSIEGGGPWEIIKGSQDHRRCRYAGPHGPALHDGRGGYLPL